MILLASFLDDPKQRKSLHQLLDASVGSFFWLLRISSTNGSKGWLEQPRQILSWRCLVRENVGNCSKFHPMWHIFLKMSDCLLSHKLPTRKSTFKVRRYMYSIARTAPLQHLPNIFSLLSVQRASFLGGWFNPPLGSPERQSRRWYECCDVLIKVGYVARLKAKAPLLQRSTPEWGGKVKHNHGQYLYISSVLYVFRCL